MNEVERLKAELAAANAKLAAIPAPKVKLKMTEKGQLSISGLRQGWGMYMRPEEFNFLTAHSAEIDAFIKSNPKAGDTKIIGAQAAAPTPEKK